MVADDIDGISMQFNSVTMYRLRQQKFVRNLNDGDTIYCHESMFNGRVFFSDF